MVRALACRGLLLCVSLLVIGSASAAFAAADPTTIAATGSVAPTGNATCDKLPSGQSCLGNQVDFVATVTDTNSGGHGSPVGSVVFTDENGVAIGWGTLTATGDGVSSKATFSTTNLTATSGTPNCATPGSHHCITAQYMNDGSGQWTNSSTKITWQVFARPTTASPSALTPLVVGTTESLTATVTDAGPAPRQIQADASPVSGGQFFLANDGKPNPVKPTVFNLLTARYGAAAASLPSGNVVVIGGTDGSTALSGTKSAELIGSGVTASAGSLAAARVFLTATTGNGGNVLIAGGSSDRCMSAADLKANGLTTNGVLGTLEKYFYQTDSFGAVSATPPTITARCGHAAVHLVSTNTTAFIGGYDANGAAMTSIEVFNPGGNGGNGTVTKVADLTTARAGAVAVLLQNGNILIAGGDAAGDAEIWDGVSATTTPAGGSMTVPRMFFGGDIMPDGNVLFAGGFSASDSSETALSSAEIYDVTTSTFGSITATLLNSTGAGPGKEMASVLVGIGAVGFAGGHDQNNAVLSTVQAYAPAYTPQGQVAFTGTSDSTDDLGGSGTPGPVACTLDVQNGTNTVACKTATTYYARHVNAGSHTVEADYLGNTNSAASTSTQAVTITPTPLMINAKDQPKVYGQTFSFLGTEFTLPSPTQLLPGDSVGSVTLTSTGAATTATYTSPGPAYDINITPGTVVFASGSAGDYSFTYGKGTMMLSQAPLTVKANDQAKPYGSSVTFSGNEFTTTPATLYNSDSVTSATLASGGAAGSATYVSPGPTYAITISNAVGSGLGNYNISYAPGTMTLSQAPLTLKANNQAKQYGNTFTFAGNEFTPFGTYYNGDQVTGASLSSSGAAPTATYIAPGPAYGISIANATGPGVGNYNITYVAGTMTLSQAPAPTVTAVNQTKQYGAVFNFLGTEFTATGLLNADKIASVTLTSTGAAGSATVVSPGPAYAVVPSNATGAALGNYLPLTAANYVNGTMTLSPAPLSVNASNLTKTYGDTYSFTGKEFTVGGPLFNGDQVSSASISSAAAAGGALFAAPGPTYSIGISNAVGSGLGNYNISYTGAMFTLTPRPLPVTAIGGSKIYGTVPSFAGTQGGTLGQFTVSNLVNGDTVTSVTMSSPGQASTAGTGSYAIVPSNPQGSGLPNYTFTPAPATLVVTPATPAMRAEKVSAKIDPTTGGTIITVHVFLFNSNAVGANAATGAPDVNPPDSASLSSSTIDIFDGTTKLNSSPIALTKVTTGAPCGNATAQDCGVEATFTSGPLKISAGSVHTINVAYAANQNFNAQSSPVGAFSMAQANAMGNANIPPATSKSSAIPIANPEPLLTGQKYTLACAIYSATTGAPLLATSATCSTSAGSTPVDLSAAPSITVTVTTQVATGELRMERLYDLAFTMPAVVLVGAGVPLVGLRRRVKRSKLLVWLGITLALVMCLVTVGCGGNGFANPSNVPVITQNSAQAGQYTIIVTATNTTSQNQYDVVSLPFTISQ